MPAQKDKSLSSTAIPAAIQPIVAKITPDKLYDEVEAGEILGLARKTMQDRRRRQKPPDHVLIGTRAVRYPGQALIDVLLAGVVVCG